MILLNKDKKLKHDDSVVSVKYSPTGRFFVSVASNGEIFILDRDRRFFREKRFHSLFTPITGFWFSEDEKWLLVGHQYGNLLIYKLPEAKIYDKIQLNTDRTDKSSILSGTSRPILDWIVLANYSARRNLYVFLEAHELFEIELKPRQVKHHLLFSGSLFETSAASLDGNQIFFGDDAGFIYCFQHDKLKLSIFSLSREVLPTQSKVGGEITMREVATSIVSLAISSERNILASTSRHGGIQLWNIEQKMPKEIEYRDVQPLVIREPAQRGWMRGIDFLPNANHLIVGSDDGTVEVWNYITGQTTDIGSLGKGIRSISVSPDGAEVAIGCKDGGVFVVPHDEIPGLASGILLPSGTFKTALIPFEDWSVMNDFSISPPRGNLFWFCIKEGESTGDLDIRRVIYSLFIPNLPLVSPRVGKGEKQFSDELNFYEGIIKPQLIERIPCEDDQYYVKSYATECSSSNKILGIGVRGDKDWLDAKHSEISLFLSGGYPISVESKGFQSLKYLGRTTFLTRDKNNPHLMKVDGSLPAVDGYARGVGLKRTLTLKSFLVERHNFKNVIHDEWFINNGYKIKK